MKEIRLVLYDNNLTQILKKNEFYNYFYTDNIVFPFKFYAVIMKANIPQRIIKIFKGRGKKNKEKGKKICSLISRQMCKE